MTEPEEEVCEINDFTTTSNWERFIVDLEEALTQWNLGGGIDDNWRSASETGVSDSSTTTTTTAAGIDPGTSTSLSSNTSNSIYLSKWLANPSLWTQRKEQLKFGKVAFNLMYCYFDVAKLKALLKDDYDRRPQLKLSKNFPPPPSQAWQDMNALDHDWPTFTAHPLVRFYGLTHFLLLLPLQNETLDTEDRVKHLIGSATIALRNRNCEVPFFAQVGAPKRCLFSGVHHLNTGFRTYFDMIQFFDVPPSFQYMSDLIVLFRKKLYANFSYNSAYRDKTVKSDHDQALSASASSAVKMLLSIRFTYLLSIWPPQYLLFNSNAPIHATLELVGTYFKHINRSLVDAAEAIVHRPISLQPKSQSSLYGDPLSQIQLATTWPSVAEELFVDNAYHSDLQPRSARRWSLRTVFLDPPLITTPEAAINQYCHYTEWFRVFCALRYLPCAGDLLSHYQITQISNVDQSNASEVTVDARLALDRLASPAASAMSTTSSVAGQLVSQFMMSQHHLSGLGSSALKTVDVGSIVQAIFNLNTLESTKKLNEDENDNENIDSRLKSAPFGSLSWRIALAVANSYARDRQLATVAQLWKVLLDHIRQCWQSAQLLPNLEPKDQSKDSQQSTTIDLRHCLFHQKLEMLNCCIRQKIKREQYQHPVQLSQADSGTDSDDEEFFDCPDQTNTSFVDAKSTSSNKAEGKLEPLRDVAGNVMHLLDNTNDSQVLYIPVTQDSAPLTEDQLRAQVQQLASLSNSPDAAKAKIELQSAGLLSDMEAFKAANPGAKFEDFIRWHSPRDWIELDLEGDDNDGDEQQKATTTTTTLTTTATTTTTSTPPRYGLSQRMRESTNLWLEIWTIARPVPVSRQKRLFNYTKEAEEILHWLESITIERLVELLAPIVAHATFRQLRLHREEILNFVNTNLDQSAAIDSKRIFLDFHSDSQTTIEAEKLIIYNYNRTQLMNAFFSANFDAIYTELSLMEYNMIRFYSIFKKIIYAYESEVKRPIKELLVVAKQAQKQAQNQKTSKTTSSVRPKRQTMNAFPNSRSQVESTSSLTISDLLLFVIKLLHESEVVFSNQSPLTTLVVRLFVDSDQFHYESTTSVGERLRSSATSDYDDGDDEKDYDEDSHGHGQQQQQHKNHQSFDGIHDTDGDNDNDQSKSVSSSSPDHKASATNSKFKSFPINRLPQLPVPSAKEFIFRAPAIARPAPYSRPCSHRLYCLMNARKDFRIATAFTDDVAYF